MSDHDTSLLPPDWAFEFHGHHCPFMPLGYRMGRLAIARLGVDREQDHTLHVVCELGEGHPQTCLMDGIQVATGATFGKTLIEKTYWGKLAATFWYPGKTAVRYSLKPSFLDMFGTQEFFAYRKKGIEPSGIPIDVTRKAIDWMLSQADDDVFAVEERPDFRFTPPKGSFNKTLCSKCGEYVFERYVRLQDGRPVCIPCSGYAR
ncbi:MAG TPA: FmdE family protein [Myxococcota bacterium]|nr:FmdE family protein [Myxococcota bacterium]